MITSFARALCLLLLLWAQPVDSIRSNRTAGATSRAAFVKEMTYTSNSLCRQNYCTNPIFPGLNDLPRLEALQWQCSTTSATQEHMDFCKGAVAYDPALPSPQSKAAAVADLVKAQEDAAMTMFVYHLNGMGFEAWDHRDPSSSDNECVRSVWKMVCFTYFPRADAGCKAGEQSFYKRPCKSCCQNYLKQCGVECCDESVACSFAHTSTSATGQVELLQSGYVDQEGPAATCTGGAKRSMSSPIAILFGIFGLHWIASSSTTAIRSEDATLVQRPHRGHGKFFLLCLVGLLMASLQGCDAQIPHHKIGNWRTKQNYLTVYKYTPPGKSEQNAVLNSCSQSDIPSNHQCSGKGYCKTFSISAASAQQQSPIAFCQCERDWADPECGTRRKSQMKAFFWSLFFGFLGADYFYLGFPLWGLGKLVTLGGCGFWWILDIVRTGVGPVYAYNFRVSHDLPHWVAILIMISMFMTTGFVVAIQNYLVYRRKKRQDVLILNNKEEERSWSHSTEEELESVAGPRYRTKGIHGLAQSFDKRPGFSGYGAMLPIPHPNAGAAYATFGQDPTRPPFAGPFGPSGSPGLGSPTPPATGGLATHQLPQGFVQRPGPAPHSGH